LSDDNDPDDSGAYYYDYIGNVTLAASTRYWVVISTTTSSDGNLHDYQAEYGAGPDAIGISGIQIQTSSDQGASWGSLPSTVSGDRLRMNVSIAEAIPEPSTIAFAGISAIGLLFALRYWSTRFRSPNTKLQSAL
jgi:hypothetical protein